MEQKFCQSCGMQEYNRNKSSHLTACEYDADGADPEIVVFKRR